MTLDRYGHLFPELDESIATAFGERLVAAQGVRGPVAAQPSFG